jgi:hypothetical protein
MARGWLLFVTAAAGCGPGGVDLEGTYQVTMHAVDLTGCANPTPVVDPPFVRFTPESILGRDYFALSACDDPMQIDCPSAGLYGPFAQPIDDGWRAEIGVAQTVGGCILDYGLADATLDHENLVLQGRRYHDESDRPERECTGERALELGDTLPCVGAENLAAVRL